jgi:hypothetical protein
MSDVGINISFPFLLALAGAYYWPIPSLLAIIAIFGAVLLRGIARYICITLAVLFLADVGLGLFLSS